MKVTHTHRGHCQLCTQVQAIDVNSGKIAKHGYSLQFGYYHGTCPGSDVLSLHVQREHADEAIKAARERARQLNADILAYTRGDAHPSNVWNGKYKRVPDPLPQLPNRTIEQKIIVPWANASEHYQQVAVQEEIENMKRAERRALSYAADLEKWAERIFQKVEAYRIKDLEPREWKVGDEVRIGGKKGFDAKIEAIEDRPYRTRGFSTKRGETLVAHALVTVPAQPEKIVGKGTSYEYVLHQARPARKAWEPLRHIKRPPSELTEMLTKEGKL